MRMNFQSRKGVDAWLSKLALFRKNIALDETSFFRSIAEQVFASQNFHEKLREMFLDYIIYNKSNLFSEDELKTYVDEIRNHIGIYGDFEMNILAEKLECDFVVYESSTFSIRKVTNFGYSQLVKLCAMKQNHFDAVFEKNHVDNMAFCQSIVYKIMFEKVCGVENVDEISVKMLTKNTASEEKIVGSGAPFPYRVAKALNPVLYRNVEFDIWHQERKAIRNQDWYTGGDNLVVGTQCLVDFQDHQMICYVQKITTYDTGSTYKVYICSLARVEEVTRMDLHPLPDAKPWATPLHLKQDNKAKVEEHYTIKRNKSKVPEDYLGCPLFSSFEKENDCYNHFNIDMLEATNLIAATSVNAYGETKISEFLYAKFGEFSVGDYQHGFICAKGEMHYNRMRDEESPSEHEESTPEYNSPPPPEPIYEDHQAEPTPPFSVTGSPSLNVPQMGNLDNQGHAPYIEHPQPILFPNHSVLVHIPVLLNAQYCMFPQAGDDYSTRNYISGCYGQVTTFPPQYMGFTSYPTHEDDNVLDLRTNSEDCNSEESPAEASDNALALPAPVLEYPGSNYNYGPTQPSRPIPVRPQNLPLMPYNSVPIYQTQAPEPLNHNKCHSTPNVPNNPPPFYNPMQPILNYPSPNIPSPMYPQYYPQISHPSIQYPIPPPYVTPSIMGSRPYPPPCSTSSPTRTYSSVTTTYSNSGQDNRDARRIPNPPTVEASSTAFSSSLAMPPTSSSPGMLTTPYNPVTSVPPPPVCPIQYGNSPQPQRPQPPKNNTKPFYPSGSNNSNVPPRPSSSKSPNNKPIYPPTSSGNSSNSVASLANQWYNAPGDSCYRKPFPRYNSPQIMMPPRYQYDGRSSGRYQNRGGYNARPRRYNNRQPIFPPPVMEEPPVDNKKKDHTIKNILDDVSTNIVNNNRVESTPPVNTDLAVTPSKSPIDNSSIQEIGPPTHSCSPALDVVTPEKTTNTAPDGVPAATTTTTVGNTVDGPNMDSVTPATISTVSAAPPQPAPENSAASTSRDNSGRHVGHNHWQNNRGRKKKNHSKGNNNNYND